MDHADLETVCQKRAVAPAPEPVFRALRPTRVEPGHVVAPVVVHDKETSAGAHDAARLGHLPGVEAAERRPGRDERVGPWLRGAGVARHVPQGDGTNARAERDQSVDERSRLAANPRDLATGERTERVERTGNLALDV